MTLRLLKHQSLLDLLHLFGMVFFALLAIWVVLTRPAFAGSAERNIVAIGGSVTEIIYALGEQDRLIARDSTSVYPPEALALPDVGYVRALSPEGVLSVGPEIVIAEEGAGPAEAIDVLHAAAITYVTIPEAYATDGVVQKILTIGRALDVPERADALANAVTKQMAEVSGKVATQTGPKRRVLFILSTAGGRILAGGRNTAAQAIISLAGGHNTMGSFEGYKPVTTEAIAAAAPDVVLMMTRHGSSPKNSDLWALPALAQTPAARNDAVVRIDGLLLLGFGPRMPQAVETLHNALYGPAG